MTEATKKYSSGTSTLTQLSPNWNLISENTETSSKSKFFSQKVNQKGLASSISKAVKTQMKWSKTAPI